MHPIIEQEMVRQQQAGLERDEARQELVAEARASRGIVQTDGDVHGDAPHETALQHLLALIVHPGTPHDPEH